MEKIIKRIKIKLKNFVKKTLLLFGLKINSDFRIFKNFKQNVFNNKHQKRVLLSYISEPFFLKNNLSHTNLLECYTSAEIFDELGFCVDVVDYNSNKKINYYKYDVIYGMGMVLEKSFYFNKKKIKRIFYATGCNPIFSNTETLLRVRDFYNSHGVMLLESSRLIEQSCYLQTFLSDGVIVLGNEFVLNTYQRYDIERPERFRNLNVFFYDIYDINLLNKNLSQARKHFLWFGSTGAIHKGLDILIDIFSEHQDIYLHVCGLSESEKGFVDYYNKIFVQSKNIINHGFINIKSKEFTGLMNECAFVIFPSASEGGGAAVLNLIANGGLIPIITESSGLNVDSFGIIIKKPKKWSVEIAINEALQLDINKLFDMAKSAKNNIRTNYTFNCYRDNLKKSIIDIIK